MHFKKEPNSCFVNNYFDICFRALKTNLNLRAVLMSLKRWKTYVNILQNRRSIFISLETNRQRSLWKQYVLLWHYKNNWLILRNKSRVFCSGGSLPYLRERKLRRIFYVLHFVNNNLPEKTIQLLFSEKNLWNYQLIA